MIAWDKNVENEIGQVITQIVNLVRPQRIILFGSAARGEMNPNSDIDLLIVVKDGVHRRRTAQFLYRNLSGVKTPFDLIVATSSDLDKHQDTIGLIYKTAMQDGRVLYAAQ